MTMRAAVSNANVSISAAMTAFWAVPQQKISSAVPVFNERQRSGASRLLPKPMHRCTPAPRRSALSRLCMPFFRRSRVARKLRRTQTCNEVMKQ
jgi:hypothetical protein